MGPQMEKNKFTVAWDHKWKKNKFTVAWDHKWKKNDQKNSVHRRLWKPLNPLIQGKGPEHPQPPPL